MRNSDGSSTLLLLLLLLLLTFSAFATASPLRHGHVRRDNETALGPPPTTQLPPPPPPPPPYGPRDPAIVHGLDNSAAIILFVVLCCVALLVPMFVYIWLRRQRQYRCCPRAILRGGEQGKDGEGVGKDEGDRDTWACEITRPERVLTLLRDDAAGGGFKLYELRHP